MSDRKYSGSLRINKIHGSTAGNRKTLGIQVNRVNALLLIEMLMHYVNSNSVKPVDITIYKSRINAAGKYATVTYL